MPTQQPGNDQPVRESSIGELLQSATTVAAIGLGLLAFFATVRPAPAVELLAFSAGAGGLYGSVVALVELLDEQRRSRRELFYVTNSIGVIFWSILFLGIAYVLLQFPEVNDTVANFLDWLEKLFRAQ